MINLLRKSLKLGVHIYLPFCVIFYYWGWIWALPVYVLAIKIFDLLLSVFGLYRMERGDITHVVLSKKFNSNIGAYFMTEKISFEEFKEIVIQRLINPVQRMKQVPVYYWSTHLWKDVDIELSKAKIVKESWAFENTQNFLEYFNDLCWTELDMSKPLFEFRVIENYTHDSSMIVFRCHHLFGDGISISSLFSALNDDQFSTLPSKQLYRPDFWKAVKLWMTWPLSLFENIRLSKPWQTDPDTKKFFKKVRTKKTTKTRYFISDDDIWFNDVRESYKKYPNSTFNDLILGILSKSLRQVFVTHGIHDPKSIKLCIPVAMKSLPTGYTDLKITNNIISMAPSIPLKESLGECISEMKTVLSNILNPDLIYKLSTLAYFVPYFPEQFNESMLEDLMEGEDVLLSNITFSQTAYRFNGKETKDFRFFNNLIGSYSLACFVYTYNQKVHFSTCMHEDLPMDGQEFQNLVMKNLENEVNKQKKSISV